MTCLDMRKTKTFRIEEKLLQALEDLASRSNRTSNAYLEELLFRHCQAQGIFSLSEEPPKVIRGGKRDGAGRPKLKKGEEIDTEE